jgi:DNA-binding HxlR family transcriptional regulator
MDGTPNRQAAGRASALPGERLRRRVEQRRVAVDEHVAALELGDRGKALIPALEQISLWSQEHLVADEA